MHSEKYIIGFSTQDYFLLDLDNTSYEKVYRLSKMLIKEYDLVSALICKSSNNQEINYIDNCLRHETEGSYHVIFSKKIGYERICQIVETLTMFGVLEKDYLQIREWRGDITLRVSPDNSLEYRPIPRPIKFINRWRNKNTYEEDGISQYLNCWNVVN
jgi:hypothetical protein